MINNFIAYWSVPYSRGWRVFIGFSLKIVETRFAKGMSPGIFFFFFTTDDTKRVNNFSFLYCIAVKKKFTNGNSSLMYGNFVCKQQGTE